MSESRLIANPPLSPCGVGNQSEALDDVAKWRVEVKEQGKRKDWMLGKEHSIAFFAERKNHFPMYRT